MECIPRPVDDRSFVWEEVWRKLDKKLNKVIASMDSTEFDGEGPSQSPVLSLQAMAKGPRLRLLRAASQLLCKEAGTDFRHFHSPSPK